MADDVNTAREIADAIKEQATPSLGPWPRDLRIAMGATMAFMLVIMS
jgi:hypothetical protein